MNQELAGKRVLVAGGTKGIGWATGLAFARGKTHAVPCYHSDAAAASELTRGGVS